jgi:hypothetical protein
MSAASGSGQADDRPLAGLRCLVCGMNNGKPTEDLVQALGGKVHIMTRASHTLPDVVVSDHAAAKRLQVGTTTVTFAMCI